MDRQKMLRWITFDSSVDTLDSFLLKWVPSQISAPSVEWICISNGKEVPKVQCNVAIDLMDAWEALCDAKSDKVDWLDVHTLARVHKVLSGKWLLFFGRNEVDSAWSVIARAVCEGKLGDSAKVSTSQHDANEDFEVKCEGETRGKLKKKMKKEGEQGQSSSYVICVYSSNFDDLKDVMALRQKLHDLGFTKRIKYKPDAYTFCGIYWGNHWRIPSTLY